MTSQRPKRERDALEFIAMLKRLIRRSGERVAQADEFELAELVELRDELETAIQVAIDGQRAVGRSWQHIADALGITRQSAHQRYGKRESA
ncbi:hypothetical protein ABC195_09495 [Microbacterium sp. 2P01SA-2]|uniref:hypothetical protein n=1 Tax=unclassified Microbacterium TaxID=2609290 RepID=UPI0039A324CA